jgi:hypothetical protein
MAQPAVLAPLRLVADPETTEPHRPTDQQQLAGGRYRVKNLRLSSGEHFALLIDRWTGIPPRLAMRFAIRLRKMGGKAGLEKKLRRLADLYNWFWGSRRVELDDKLRLDPTMNIEVLILALDELDALLKIDLPIAPTGVDDDDDAAEAARVLRENKRRNNRISAWSDFLRYTHRPALWDFAIGVERGHAFAKELKPFLKETISELNLERREEGVAEHHKPLTELELEAIHFAFERNAARFSSKCRLRNESMFYVCRIAGTRIGETLKMLDSDAPKAESALDQLLRNSEGPALEIKVRRRNDDPKDPRRNEARVKRHGRDISVADDLVQLLREYLEYKSAQRPRARSTYLFLVDDLSRPLSISTANKIIKKISVASAEIFERMHPEKPCSLRKLTWHRLRVTRVVELVPIFFPNNESTEHRVQQFLDFFGWAKQSSAKTYLKSLNRKSGDLIVKTAREELRSAAK